MDMDISKDFQLLRAGKMLFGQNVVKRPSCFLFKRSRLDGPHEPFLEIPLSVVTSWIKQLPIRELYFRISPDTTEILPLERAQPRASLLRFNTWVISPIEKAWCEELVFNEQRFILEMYNPYYSRAEICWPLVESLMKCIYQRTLCMRELHLRNACEMYRHDPSTIGLMLNSSEGVSRQLIPPTLSHKLLLMLKVSYLRLHLVLSPFGRAFFTALDRIDFLIRYLEFKDRLTPPFQQLPYDFQSNAFEWPSPGRNRSLTTYECFKELCHRGVYSPWDPVNNFSSDPIRQERFYEQEEAEKEEMNMITAYLSRQAQDSSLMDLDRLHLNNLLLDSVRLDTMRVINEGRHHMRENLSARIRQLTPYSPFDRSRPHSTRYSFHEEDDFDEEENFLTFRPRRLNNPFDLPIPHSPATRFYDEEAFFEGEGIIFGDSTDSGIDSDSENEIEALPLATHFDKGEACSICLNVLEAEVVRLSCRHLFHSNCITPWLRKQSTCAYCRDSVQLEEINA